MEHEKDGMIFNHKLSEKETSDFLKRKIETENKMAAFIKDMKDKNICKKKGIDQ
jgi:hypothetical protein